GVIGVYTAEPMTTTTRETLEEDYGDGTVQERTTKVYYHERLAESVSNNVYEFFRYSLPVTMTGCFLVT
ncbi:MAG: hypothetical protein GWN01_11090, partial [Nitrosopumilaceae archaeon]|nr:hypothetical protein [Nitrosopumilaceae archaeon]NIU86827.1 hypothetical protein [Nitrosopumilaceae archaeon]NIV65708.1 hypothetical protein [Nitrosopumilaceae archaeon]NIX62031.1 hypothetical protein [Nitrosopumilaceae archaeon]